MQLHFPFRLLVELPELCQRCFSTEFFTEAFASRAVLELLSSVLVFIAALGLGLVDFLLSACFSLRLVFLSRLSRSHWPTIMAASCFSVSLLCCVLFPLAHF